MRHMIDKVFGLFSHDVGIDLGTANTLVSVKGKGIVIREPSVVAMHKKTKKVIAIGTEAKKMVGKTPPTIVTVRPLKGGVIADFDATEAMIAYYIKEVHAYGNPVGKVWARPRIAIGIPSAVTEVQRRAVWEASLASGAREAFLIEEPMAAAIGDGINIFQSNGVMVVDIGGGTTDIAVISLGGIVVGKSIRVAGDDMNQAILHYVRLRHGLLLGEKTAEDIKIQIGSAYETKSRVRRSPSPQGEQTIKTEKQEGADAGIKERKEKVALIRGRDLETGLPRSLRVSEAEVREALAPVVSQIVDGVVEVLEESPPELLSDVLETGILLTGGGALLSGLDQMIVERTHMPVVISSDPLTSVVRGTAKVLEDSEILSRVKVTGGLK